MILLNLDDLAAHARSDLAQLALLIGRRLVDGGNAEIDNRSTHGSALPINRGRGATGRMNNKLIFRTEIYLLKMRGFIDVARLNFRRVFPYTRPVDATPVAALRA
jgi:hypothetical protein